MSDGPLLYVHPYNHVLDDLVPMGAVALLNRVRAPKQGRFAWSLTEEEIRSAGAVAMDLHWYFSVEAVRWIARDVKRLAPETPVILGGITASFYARYLLANFPVDYVIQGDGEYSFPRLVEALLEGREPPPLPNVWTRRGPPPARRDVGVAEYDANDYLTLDWFPELEQWTRRHHGEYALAPFWGQMDRYHPYLPLNRGCRFPCDGCFGSYQRDVFGNSQVDRSAESLARNLDAIEAHPDYRFVSLTGGTEDMARWRPWREVFGRRRALSAYVMHFCDLPGDDELEMVVRGFSRVCMDFTNPSDVPLPLRASGWSIAAAEDRIFQIARMLDGNRDVRVGISFMDTEPHPFKDRLRAVDWQTVEFKENSEWALPRPNLATLPGEDEEEAVLPALPIPRVERRLLSRAQREAREAAKARQAEGFRAVSRGHARYLLARAISPGLHALLDQSYLKRVDGAPVARLAVEDPAVQGFLDWYVARYRTWFVTTLEAVDVVVSAAPEAGEGLLAAGPQRDLGVAAVREGFDGIRVAWRGRVPAGARGLTLRARLRWERAGEVAWLDPAAIPGLPRWVIALPEGRAAAGGDEAGEQGVSVGVFATVGPKRGVLGLYPPEAVDPQGIARPTAPAWAALGIDAEARPATPLDPVEDAEKGWGPDNLVEAPWEDAGLPAAIDAALAAGAAEAGWGSEGVECSARWVCRDFWRGEERARLFVLPPGEAPGAWRGERCRLVVYGEEPTEAVRGLMGALQVALGAI
jgi:hypothetical protein